MGNSRAHGPVDCLVGPLGGREGLETPVLAYTHKPGGEGPAAEALRWAGLGWQHLSVFCRHLWLAVLGRGSLLLQPGPHLPAVLPACPTPSFLGD